MYIKRRDRTLHPDGACDSGGRWHPSDTETCSCCSEVRAPSRAWPWSLMTHCRSVGHVAKLFDVQELDVRRRAREIEDGVAKTALLVVSKKEKTEASAA
jgi:hypothetical protein